MRRGATAASLILLVGSLTSCRSLPSAPRLTDDPSSVDFTRLRAELGGRSDFVDRCERERPLHRLAEFVRQSDWADVLAASEPWLQKCPVDIDAHLIRSIALKELGRVAESQHHVLWFRGLVDSVLTSGDGRTPQTAFLVISVAEEFSILRVLRLRPTRHVTLSSGVDELFVEADDVGLAGVVYFNPAAHVRRLGERPVAPR